MLKNVKNERSVSEIVREVVDSSPHIRTALEMDLLNYSALARHLIQQINKKYNKKVSKESIIVAAIRYQKEMTKKQISEKLKRGISECSISIRSDIIDLTFQKSPPVQEIVDDFNSKIDWKNGGVMFMVQGRNEIEIILDRINYNKIKELIPKEMVLNVIHNLTAVSIHQPSTELTFVPGFYAFLLNNLAINNVNVIEVMSTLTEVIIVVPQEQASKTFEILNEIIENFRK